VLLNFGELQDTAEKKYHTDTLIQILKMRIKYQEEVLEPETQKVTHWI